MLTSRGMPLLVSQIRNNIKRGLKLQNQVTCCRAKSLLRLNVQCLTLDAPEYSSSPGSFTHPFHSLYCLSAPSTKQPKSSRFLIPYLLIYTCPKLCSASCLSVSATGGQERLVIEAAEQRAVLCSD